jgi:hypothetical protein
LRAFRIPAFAAKDLLASAKDLLADAKREYARTGSGLIRDLTGLYRPERHYMRGPGPAWRAKHPEA